MSYLYSLQHQSLVEKLIFSPAKLVSNTCVVDSHSFQYIQCSKQSKISFSPTKADIPHSQEGHHGSFSELNYERDRHILLMEIPLNPQNYTVRTL